MARLIDADRLLRDPYFQEERYPCSHLIRMAVGEQRTVDAVEVVRCKDCRWRKERGLCYMISGTGVGTGTGDDFFCSYGERKDNGC